MPPVVAAIAVYFAVSSAMATFILVTGISMAFSIGYSAYMMASTPGTPGLNAAGRTQVIRSAAAPHRIIYGECMVSGPLVASFATGTSNKYIYLVIVLASHECESIGDVYLGDKLSTDATFQGLSTQGAAPSTIETLTVTGGAVTVSQPTRLTSTVSVVDAGGDPIAYTVADGVYTVDSAYEGADITVTYFWSYAKITKYLGAAGQSADPDMVANAKDIHGNPAWTTDHKLSGRTYIVARLEYDQNIFPQGLPNIKAVVKGSNTIYDPRTSTSGQADNWALCIRDYLVKPFGLKCVAGDINDDYAIAAANICDEQIQLVTGTGTGYMTDGLSYDVGRAEIGIASGTGTILAGDIITFNGDVTEYRVATGTADMNNAAILLVGNGLVYSLPATGVTDPRTGLTGPIAITVKALNYESRYTCNGTFTLDTKPIDVLKNMLTAAAGRLVWSQGKYEIYPAAYSTPESRTLTESDLRDSISVAPMPSRRDRINTVRGTFVDPTQYWQQTSYPMVRDAAAYAIDGEELAASVELQYTTSNATTQRLATIHLKRTLKGMMVTFPGKLTCFGYKPGNVVKLNIVQLGWVNKEFRITDWKMSDTGGVDLMMQEEDASIYGWTTANQVLPSIIAKPLATSATVVSAPASLAVTDAADAYTGSVTRSKTTFTWDSTDAMTTGYVVQLDGVDYATVVTNQYIVSNLKPGAYIFGVIAMNASGVRSTVASATHTVTTPSGTMPPGVVITLTDEGTPGQPSKRLALINGELGTVEV
jgi:hypothetical protein